MYIYQTLPSGIPADEDWSNATEGMRIIEIEGDPAPMVGIKFSAADKAPQSMGAARTFSGRLAGPGPQSDMGAEAEYWADRPGGLCGGQRARTTFAEEFAVSLWLPIFVAIPLAVGCLFP